MPQYLAGIGGHWYYLGLARANDDKILADPRAARKAGVYIRLPENTAGMAIHCLDISFAVRHKDPVIYINRDELQILFIGAVSDVFFPEFGDPEALFYFRQRSGRRGIVFAAHAR